MAKIYDFQTRKRTDVPDEPVLGEALSEDQTETFSRSQGDAKAEAHPQGKVKSPRIDKETYLLWMFSKDIDELINRYILEHHLKPHELAAILSHRLGQLVATTGQPERLEEFCQTILKRMALVSEAHGAKHDRGGSPLIPTDDKGAS